MKNSNLALRISLGALIFSFLLPFYQLGMIFEGALTLSGFASAFGADFGGGKEWPGHGPLGLGFILGLVAFLICMRKKPIGRWIGILPLGSFWFLFNNIEEGGNVLVSLKPLLGIYLATLSALVAAVIGFIGRTIPSAEPTKAMDAI
jgi:hypothetical protein